MKNTILLLAVGLAFAGASSAAETGGFSRFSVAGAAGLNGPTVEGIHLALAPSVSLNRHFAVGADVAYTYLPLSQYARGGGNRAYWGLLTLAGEALPSHRVSPYLVLGYGLGRYEDGRGDAEVGRAASLGAGLKLRLAPRAHLFVESRFAMMDNFVARDGLHLELPVRVGVRVAF